ncbi:alpha/beta fold hydrolase [Spiroplasma platyhelix]|uniref:Alpha/beta hydrolase n=1 Tax=Spiroplasma platyhelix PALS-1 TaxID=1276218 RepID=A0A846TQU4_9MOLU|nr:alpha/beta fold hydrolase [Spiroplasma platyhelix]MBE4704338.1 Monoacylglycerol lipase [Spiroplasma platyhelix PALS-1]NKE38710.1 alpha/beta hydrolase [Spiroplasma platyhelix PALS-1]UJB28920.1 lysophospholipase [Spiroplasma platyhelix PALS-1]
MALKEWDQTLRDGTKLHMYEWKPDKLENVKGILQLVHGSAEHSKRYDDFAKYLVKNDYIVISDDHRGHGKTAQNKEDLGFFAEENGWETIVDDLYEVTLLIKKMYPNLPIVMFGHSMGSFMEREYIIKYGTNISAAVICGTMYHTKMVLKISQMIAKHHQKKLGSKEKDQMVYNLSYARFNKRFNKEGATGVEWISTDKKVQKAFKEDPLSGQVFSTSAFKDMFTGLMFINSKKNIKKGPKDLPIFFISGEDDPVGNFGKGVKKVYKLFKKHYTNVSFKLYPHARHEILNEPIKTDVYQDILIFYNQAIKTNEPKKD